MRGKILIFDGQTKTLNSIGDAVQSITGATIEDMRKRDQSEPITTIKLAFMGLAYNQGCTIGSISKHLQLCHSTCQKRIKGHDSRLEVDSDYEVTFNAIEDRYSPKGVTPKGEVLTKGKSSIKHQNYI